MKILMEALAVVAIGLTLASCATSSETAKPQVVAATPAGIEMTIWCQRGTPCRQTVADAAEAHCQKVGKNAQLAQDTLVERSIGGLEKGLFQYICVR